MICKIIKLVTGETIAGNVVEETSLYIDVMRPVRLVVSPKGNTSVSILFGKWDYTVNFDLPIRVFKSGLVSVGEPMDDFKNSYKEMYDEAEKEILSFDEKEDDDLSSELGEIVKAFSNTTSNTETKTFH
jgi:hypothetical protein